MERDDLLFDGQPEGIKNAIALAEHIKLICAGEIRLGISEKETLLVFREIEAILNILKSL